MSDEQKIKRADILDIVSRYYGIPVHQLKSSSRKRHIGHVRFMYHLLAKNEGYSLPNIAKIVNQKDHTSVLHGARRMQAWIDEGGQWKSDYDELNMIMDQMRNDMQIDHLLPNTPDKDNITPSENPFIAKVETLDHSSIEQMSVSWEDKSAFKRRTLLTEFAQLLNHYLSLNGYPTGVDLKSKIKKKRYNIYNRDTIEQLASHIPSWQENDRTLPYDTKLVAEWMTGKTLPSPEAWEGIFYYLQQANPPIPQSAYDYMEALYEEIFSRQYANCASEAEIEGKITLRSRLYNAGITIRQLDDYVAPEDRSYMPEGIILLKETQLDQHNSPKIGRNIVMLNNNTSLSLPYFLVFDHLIESKTGDKATPSLTDIYWHQHCEQTKKALHNSSKFTDMLDAAITHIELSRPKFANKLPDDIQYFNIYAWVNAKVDSSQNPLLPSQEQLEQMISALKETEATLLSFYQLSFEPLINDDFIRELQNKYNLMTHDKHASYVESHNGLGRYNIGLPIQALPSKQPAHKSPANSGREENEINDTASRNKAANGNWNGTKEKTPPQIFDTKQMRSEMAVLRDSAHPVSYGKIAQLYSTSKGAIAGRIRDAKTDFGEHFERLSKVDRMAARKRVNERLEKAGFPKIFSTQIGSIQSDQPKEAALPPKDYSPRNRSV